MLKKHLWNKKWGIIAFILLTVLGTAMMSVFSLEISSIFDAAELGDYKLVIKLFGLMFIWYLFIRLIDYYTELVGVELVNTIRRNIKNDLFSAIIYKDLPSFSYRNSGEYIAEFTNDITIIETKYLLPLKQLITHSITIATSCAAIFTIDWKMTLILIIGASLCIIFPIVASKYTSNKMLTFLERFDIYVQYLKDNFSAFFTFKNYAIEKKIVERFAKENSDIEEKKYDAEIALLILGNLVGRLAWLVQLLVVMLGIVGVLNNDISIGNVFSAYLLAGTLGLPFQSIGKIISEVRSVKGIERKFLALYSLDDSPKNHQEYQDNISLGKMDICFQNVSLSLKDNLILKNVSFNFEHGKKYLIIGSNGSGKSTTSKLVKRTYSNYTGKILVGGYDLNSHEGRIASDLVSYSNETVSLLSDTVKNNILLYREISDETLQEAMKTVGLSVPVDRQIGDGGKFLSSGERRKLEIARALVKNPQVLILDEVVSTLDIETAYEIEKLVLDLDTTVIMVSNAFSGKLIEKYDAIILMDNGQIISSGSHKELLEKSKMYRKIYEIRCGTGIKEAK